MMKKSLIIAISVLIIVIAGGVGAAYLLVFQPRVTEYRLTAMEFGFNGHSGGPTLTVKAGEPVRISITNMGGIRHEFMVVKDKDAFLSDVRKAVEELTSKGIKDPHEIEESHEYMMAMEKWGLKIVKVGQELDWHVHFRRGETVTFELVFTTPGTYWYICGLLDATLPETHADRGMFGQIIVQS